MRYNNRITLVTQTGPPDELHGTVSETQTETTCLTIPITDTRELEAYGLVDKMAYEVHLKNPQPRPSRVLIDGTQYTVTKVYVNRKSTVLIVAGGVG